MKHSAYVASNCNTLPPMIQVMLFREIIIGYCGCRTDHVSKLCGKSAEFLIIKHVVRTITSVLESVTISCRGFFFFWKTKNCTGCVQIAHLLSNPEMRYCLLKRAPLVVTCSQIFLLTPRRLPCASESLVGPIV